MEQLEQQRQRIQDDLRGQIAGDVLCDEAFLHLYASDGSIYQIRPVGVVRPRSVADVVACVQYAAEKHIPLHARGGGSGIAGESLGPGLVIDFSKYLRRIIRTGEGTVRVQAGVVPERLNAHLAPQGRVFRPDPANGPMSTIGSMIAVDAAGSRRLRYGSTGRYVRSVQVVLADGRLLELGREPLPAGTAPPSLPPGKELLLRRLTTLLERNTGAIDRYFNRFPVCRAGYRLCGALADGYLDVPRLLSGSEGTLALITEATLATEPLLRYRGTALLLFDSLEKAARTALELTRYDLSACDLMDRRHVTLVREEDIRFDLLVPREAEAVLLVEQEGDDAAEVRERLQQLVDEVRHQNRRAFGVRQAFDPQETDLFWQLASRFQPAFYRLKGMARPAPVVEDMAVPPNVLPEFIVRLQNVLKRHDVTASIFCHALHGQVHLRPFFDLASPADMRTMRLLADDVYREALDSGGSVGGEHACGLARTPYLMRQFGDLYGVLREVKEIFDPAHIFNPGKIVADEPGLPPPELRPAVPSGEPAEGPTGGDAAGAVGDGLRNLVELQLNWDARAVAPSVAACNGCGECRTQQPGLRMCPIFRMNPAEEASPRAKANLLRGVLTGRLGLNTLTSSEFNSIAQLCVHCHMCRLECPAGVDIPRLMREGKGAYVAAQGLTLADWIMTRLDLLGAAASLASWAANWAIGNRQMRWLLEKTLGVAQGRKLPRVAPRSFLRRSVRRRLNRLSRRSGQKVLYFVDVYANYFDPQLAEAFVAVLEHNGIDVYVQPDQRQAGMPAIARGALDYARRLAQHNVRLLAEGVRQGYRIVATEPSAALCLTREYPQMVDEEDAHLVAANTSEACDYLWKLHMQGQLQLDLRPINTTLAYHLPCHLKALQVGTPGKNLLALIPGLQVQRVEEGCSGMAGTFGLERRHYRASLRAGWGLISRLRDPGILAGTTECSTCKMQMEQGTNKPTLHPIKVLALAYGLMPEIAPLLTTSGAELTVT